MLRNFCSDIQMLMGEFDEDDVSEAERYRLTVGSFRIDRLYWKKNSMSILEILNYLDNSRENLNYVF